MEPYSSDPQVGAPSATAGVSVILWGSDGEGI